MPKFVFCAYCGKKLQVFRKAVPSQQRIYDLVQPHKCEESLIKEDFEKTMERECKTFEGESPVDLGNLFDSFKFVKKLNKLDPKPAPSEQETGDKRDREHLRKELVTSTAPVGVLDNLKVTPDSTPEGDISEEPDE